MEPSVGRIVHYCSDGSTNPQAAIITALIDGHDHGYVALAVFNPTGLVFLAEVPFSAAPKYGHWSWPLRV